MALIRVRRGTTAAWGSANPILASGEPGYDETTKVFKVGDGTSTWSELPELGSGDASDSGIAALVGDENSLTFTAIEAVAEGVVAAEVDTAAISANTAARHTHSNSSVLNGTQASFTTALKNKLDGIEALADVTDAVNVSGAGAVMTTGSQAIGGSKMFTSPVLLPNASPSSENQAARKKYVDDQLSAAIGGLAPPVSADPDNGLGTGSDGGAWIDTSGFQPAGDYIDQGAIEAAFKFVAPIWVLEDDEDETDLPSGFPTAPLFSGGPPPIVLRKKPE